MSDPLMPSTVRRFLPAVAGIAVTAALSSCTAPADAPPSSSTPSRAENSSVADYADGQYSAEGQYGGLPSTIGVTVTLARDVITAVDVTPHATDPTSLDLQKRFAAAVPAVVVGRDIDEIKVDRLAGSSGTPQGFNTALDQIKTQAAQRNAS